MSETPPACVRQDAEKWRERAVNDGEGIDRRAEKTLEILDEIGRLRVAVAALGGIVCPRCEGQRFDVETCGVCRNVGWLNGNAEAFNA